MPAAPLILPRPDDWHVHLRDGAMLQAVVMATARDFARAIVMPNLQPPITTSALAAAYRERIRACLPAGCEFDPLMTLYLTDGTDANDLLAGVRDGILTAVKLYPAGATTHAEAGVTDVRLLDGVFEAMSAAAIPLLVHGEVVDDAIDIFDREAVFIERILEPLRTRHPHLKIVFEHVTTAEAVAYVSAADPDLLAATITPHHLALNRNAMFRGGIRPHAYCLPVIKRERHRAALLAAATSGDAHFFLGTDSAPHARASKEAVCGCAGLYNAPTALATYAELFETAGRRDALAAFAALNGPRFYGLPVNTDLVTLEHIDTPVPVDATGPIAVFEPPFPLHWRVAARP